MGLKAYSNIFTKMWNSDIVKRMTIRQLLIIFISPAFRSLLQRNTYFSCDDDDTT